MIIFVAPSVCQYALNLFTDSAFLNMTIFTNV